MSAIDVLFERVYVWPVLGARLWWEEGVPDRSQFRTSALTCQSQEGPYSSARGLNEHSV